MAKSKRALPAREAKSQRKAIMIKMDDEIRNELEVLSLSRHKSMQELGLEAICDLLQKYGRPVSLIDAWKKSARGAIGGKPRRKARRKN
jgi:hypothetical protein